MSTATVESFDRHQIKRSGDLDANFAICQVTGLRLGEDSDMRGRGFIFVASGERAEEMGWNIKGSITHIEFVPAQKILRLWSGTHFIQWMWDERNKNWGLGDYVTPIHLGRRGKLTLID